MITGHFRIEPMMDKPVTLSPEEIGYLMGLLQEPLNYYRTLAGSSHCTDSNREWHAFLQGLWTKLAK